MIKRTNLDFDFELFLAEYNRIKHTEINYARGGKDAPFWKVIRDKNLNSELGWSYAEELKEELGIPGKINVSFYRLLANETLPWHTDTDTKCSLNFILNANEAPVSYESGTYTYKQALINTEIPHMVENGDVDRILYKISIFDLSFEEMELLV